LLIYFFNISKQQAYFQRSRQTSDVNTHSHTVKLGKYDEIDEIEQSPNTKSPDSKSPIKQQLNVGFGPISAQLSMNVVMTAPDDLYRYEWKL
jgi:hypothetical protein